MINKTYSELIRELEELRGRRILWALFSYAIFIAILCGLIMGMTYQTGLPAIAAFIFSAIKVQRYFTDYNSKIETIKALKEKGAI